MSFSSEAKIELTKIKIKNKSCIISLISAYITSLYSFNSKNKIKFLLITENYEVLNWVANLIKKTYKTKTQIEEFEVLAKQMRFSLEIKDEKLLKNIIIGSVGVEKNEDILQIKNEIPIDMINSEKRRRCYLRGMFLGCGSVSDPEKGYHLEFVLRNEDIAQSLYNCLNIYNLNAKIMIRKGNYVVYLKESNRITELLSLIGAFSAVLKLEDVWVYKNLRNTLNRQVNFETANLQKTASAAVRQMQAIKVLINNDTLATLSPQLQQAAQLRLQKPEATLDELGKMMSPPLGKSGINHRLRKIEQIAKQASNRKE